jgi:hypothetical protein
MAGAGRRCCNQAEAQSDKLKCVRRSELHAILSGRNCEPEGASNEFGIHHQANQRRDLKIESGIASARRPSEEDDAGQGTTKNISRWAKKNCSRTTGTVGED